VSPPLSNKTEIGVIRFTRRIARQCCPSRSGIPDWAVCDAIANGSRLRVGRRGTRGGTVFRFERTYPGARGGAGSTLHVLAELTPKGCFALQLLFPSRIRRKIWDVSGFLNRTGSK
jgi:hypothetical protein